jgi:predicted nucleic acid-binding protein
MIVLDTDVLTLLSYGKEKKIAERIESIPAGEVLVITAITRMEVLLGRYQSILKAASAAEMEKAAQLFRGSEEVLNDFEVLHPNTDSCRHFEALIKQKRRRNMGRKDLIIASIALAHNALLVTRNTKDYQGVSGLRIENWVD